MQTQHTFAVWCNLWLIDGRDFVSLERYGIITYPQAQLRCNIGTSHFGQFPDFFLRCNYCTVCCEPIPTYNAERVELSSWKTWGFYAGDGDMEWHLAA
jgi:hypothetical protein